MHPEKAFADILICCCICCIYFIFHMANLLNNNIVMDMGNAF